MADKQWFIFYIRDLFGLQRYMLEHDAVGEFESPKEYFKWQKEMRGYFIKITGKQHPRIVAIEPAEFAGVYIYKSTET